MMRKINKNFVGYSIFAIFMLVFFLQVRFPGKAVENYLLETATERYPAAFLSLESLSLSIPPGLKMQNLLFGFRDNLEANIRLAHLKIRPRFIGYLMGRTSLAIDSSAYGGTLWGRVNFPHFFPNQSLASADIKFEGLTLEKCSYLQDRLGRQLSGRLSGSFVSSGDSRLDFNVQNGSYQLLANLFGLDKIDFSLAEGQILLKGGLLKISKLQLKGDKISCSLKGDIVLKPDFKSSELNLSGTMQIANMNNKKIAMTITGTVANPNTKYL